MYFGFDDISIQYGKKTVVKDIHMEFHKGKIITLIGQNGCGKSSLLKTISGAVKPSKGNVVFENRSLRSYHSKKLAQRIAYLPQVHNSPEDIDVRTLVSYGRYPYTRMGRGLNQKDTEIIDKTLSLTGLTDLKDHILSTLSGGERQRAWIAMAICQQPEILILDEPTTYLDISYQVEVLELVKHLNQTLGITIIMVLHDLNMAARYSDYLYAIRDAGVCAKGCPNDVMTEERLEEIFKIKSCILEDKINDCPYFIPLRTTFQKENYN